MRSIDRSKLSPPEILFDKRAEDERRQVLAFIEQTYSKGGTRRVPRPDWLDADPGFCKEMAGLFSDLCAYCESPAGFEPEMVKSSGPGSSGMVRRHRPHALAQDEDGNTELLAYCWLMYDWDNCCGSAMNAPDARATCSSSRASAATHVSCRSERKQKTLNTVLRL